MITAAPQVPEHTLSLLRYIEASPSPYHAVAEAGALLGAAGFAPLSLQESWDLSGPGRWFTVKGGALVAWVVSEGGEPTAPLRLVGAHTDSPNLRVKARPETGRAGWRQLGVEVYGGVLLNSWLDRDLGLSGRIAVRDPGAELGHRLQLVKVDEPLLRVPQLAIHLDRDVNDKGLLLNKQTHLSPVWGLGSWREGELLEWLADRYGVAAHDILSWDLMLHDLTPPTIGGADRSMVLAPRLDNLCSAFAAVTALIDSAQAATAASRPLALICLFDHEEVGSASATGAAGAFLAHVIERVVLARGGGREDLLRSLAGSVCASADMAHATHPNYPERHEPDHLITLDGGPVIKLNANQRYASDAIGVAAFQLACDQAGVPTQRYIHRSDLACGSTIGPLTAAGLSIPTVDVGVAQLSMHSARELCGSIDPERLTTALTAFLSPQQR